MNHILIDTNAYSALMAGEESVLNVIADADIVYVSVFVIGVLLTGFKKRYQRERQQGSAGKIFIKTYCAGGKCNI
jgi:predicted nucleic acid-binding protein